MTEHTLGQGEIDQFILNRIESAPHLEALLLVWRNRPETWAIEELAQRLYVKPEVVKSIVEGLVREQLLVALPGSPELYGYASKSAQQDRLIRSVDETYRRELVRVSNLIHSKPSAAVREFARAFRFTKEKE